MYTPTASVRDCKASAVSRTTCEGETSRVEGKVGAMLQLEGKVGATLQFEGKVGAVVVQVEGKVVVVKSMRNKRRKLLPYLCRRRGASTRGRQSPNQTNTTL